MIKRFCDLCKNEMRIEDFYIIQFGTSTDKTRVERDACHDCYWKVQGFIKTLGLIYGKDGWEARK